MSKENEVKKEYLCQYIRAKKRIDNLKNQLLSLQEVEQSAKSQQLSDMPKGSSHNGDLSDLMVRIEQLRGKIRKEIENSIKIRTMIEESIFRLQNEDEVSVLRMKYIEGMGWKEIGTKIHYGRTKIYIIHENALKNIVIREKCEQK